MKKIISAFAVMLLASCASTGAKLAPDGVVVITEAERAPPAAPMQECRKAQGLEDGSFGAVVRSLADALDALSECEAKRKELQDFIER